MDGVTFRPAIFNVSETRLQSRAPYALSHNNLRRLVTKMVKYPGSRLKALVVVQPWRVVAVFSAGLDEGIIFVLLCKQPNLFDWIPPL